MAKPATIAMARSLLAVGLLPTFVTALLMVNYPLNLQLPPVAFVDQPYQYQLASTTFQFDSDTIQYSLVGAPSWLSLDSSDRTLSGTPRTSDLGEASFEIVAASLGGAVVNMDSKLLISNRNGTSVKGNITQVLATAGQLSGPRTISIGPSKPIDITFPPDTFDNSGRPLNYYAELSDHTPLPAWISFDASTLHFLGTTPPITSTQTFELSLIACEVPGYSVASITFTLAVSNHQLFFQPYDETLNLSKNDEVQLTDLESKLLLDGAPIQKSQIRSINATLPSWLRIDNETSEISGRAPSGLMSQDLTVTATDQFDDVAHLNLHLKFNSDLFTSKIGQLNITIGDDFVYTIPQSMLASGDERLSVDLSSLSRYLQFDAAKSTISGTITDGFPSQKVQCTLTAMSSDGTRRDTQIFQIAVFNAPQNEHPDTSAGSADLSSADNDKSGRIKAGIIIGSVLGGICGILLLIAFAFCMYRRQKRKTSLSPKLPKPPRKSDIGQPDLIHYAWPDADIDRDQDIEKGEEDHDFPLKRAPEKAPMLDLDLPLEQRDSRSLTDSIGDADTDLLDHFDRSSWGFQNDNAPSQHPHASMKIPTEELSKRLSQRSDTYRKHRRQTTTVYQDQIHRRSGLPVNRRITSMGHGRHMSSPSRRSSVRRPLSTSSYYTKRTSACSTAPSTTPQPSAARRHNAKVTTQAEKRCSIRVVPSSTHSLVDRPLDEKRNSYIRHRASAPSPFFSGASNRVSSSSYKPNFVEESKRNTIVRPNEDVLEGTVKELPDSSAPKTPAKEFPGSLRNHRLSRPHTLVGVPRDRVEKSYVRSVTSIGNSVGRRASARDSLRSYELKSRLNDLTGSEIFKDAELSDSEYTDEENEIKEAERRVTVKPDEFTLPPLNIDTRPRRRRNSVEEKSKRDSVVKQKRVSTKDRDNIQKQKRASKRDSQRESKHLIDRDPTPFYSAYHGEHGGKENLSSTYSLGNKSSPMRIDAQNKTKTPISVERPKPLARHSRTISDAQNANRASAHRASKAISQTFSEPQDRYSRKSIHARTRSPQRGSTSKASHSRSQSAAYPHFDVSSLDKRYSSIGNAITTSATEPQPATRGSKHSFATRDLSGNLTFYGDDEEPTVEELGSSSIGFRTSNGRINSNARRSRLASLHESSQFGSPSPPPKSSRRQLAIPSSSPMPSSPMPSSPMPSSPPVPVRNVGLGLFPVDARAELEKERRPVSRLQSETPEVEDSKLEVQKGRQTWGSWRNVVGRGSRWVSGGYWDKQGKEDKAFI